MLEENSGAILEDRLVGEISDRFFVPDYQRGYRWGEVEVGHLLNDIWASGGEPYYLQPVVVKAMDDGRWELVDGQQRLTTLYLIFQYMHRAGLKSAGPSYSIEYQTRPDSERYLREIGSELADDADAAENIDYFHISQAYDFIEAWFGRESAGRRQLVADKIFGYLYESVKVIWYQAPAELNEKTLFTRLNVGRIPLTDAELVKAIVLSKSRASEQHDDRALEIASQWDAIERDLRTPEVWAFVTGDREEQPTHIRLLLDTLAGGPTGRDRPLFHTFETLRAQIETSSAQQVWNRVVDLHSLVLGWYEDRDLFHRIGYLVATGVKFSELVAMSEQQTKRDFKAGLDALVRTRLRLTAADLGDLGYERNYDKCMQVLLLMNVETIGRAAHSFERYSFDAHASGSWSLEHVHAQQARSLDTVEQWTAWLSLHRDALTGLIDVDPGARDELIARIDDSLPGISGGLFAQLQADIATFFTQAGEADETDLDSISNLALLDGSANSVLNNSVFEVKRLAILELDRTGSYIPVCTRNVFLKYYTRASGQNVHFWGRADRDGYFEALTEIVRPYLLEEVTS